MNKTQQMLLGMGSILLILASFSFAKEPVSTGFWSNTAIDGTDTVAYHDQKIEGIHQSIPGRKKYVIRWKEADWYFATQKSAVRFADAPEKFAPTYNGFCANALSIHEGLINTDGQVYEFFGDQLFLFYAEKGRQRWLKGSWQDYKQAADAAWRAESK